MKAERNSQHGRNDEPAPELAQRIVAAAAPQLRQLRWRRWRRRATLPVLAGGLVAGLLLWLRSEPGQPVLNATAGLARADGAAAEAQGAGLIAARLQADGRFDPASWTGPANAELGLQSLALLALARTDDSRHAGELLRGARWLLSQQERDGSFGPAALGGQDQALATLALLEISTVSDELDLRSGARRAVRALQTSLPAGRDTAWRLLALERAAELRLGGDLQGAIAQARRSQGAGARVAQSELEPLSRAEFGELPAAAAAVLALVASAH